MNNNFCFKNRVSHILLLALMAGFMNLWAAPNQARTVALLPFESRVKHSPNEDLGFGYTLFGHSAFLEQISALETKEEWAAILENTDFSYDVEAVGDWLIITGIAREILSRPGVLYKPGYIVDKEGKHIPLPWTKQSTVIGWDDAVIFIHIPTQQIAAICLSKRVTALNNGFSEGLENNIYLTYRLKGHQTATLVRTLPDNCGHNDVKRAVEQWMRLEEVLR